MAASVPPASGSVSGKNAMRPAGVTNRYPTQTPG